MLEVGLLISATPGIASTLSKSWLRVDIAGLTKPPSILRWLSDNCPTMPLTLSIWDVAARLPRYGVTAFLPTIVTSPLATIAAAQSVLQAGPPPGFKGATPFCRLLRAVAQTGMERIKFTTSFPRDFHPDIVAAIDEQLSQRMALVREIVSLGRSARVGAKREEQPARP